MRSRQSSNYLYDYLSAIHGVNSVDDAFNTTVDFMADLGVSQNCIIIDHDKPSGFVQHTGPAWAYDSWAEIVGFNKDPASIHCREKLTPYIGGSEFEPNAPQSYLEWLGEISSININTFVSIPWHTGKSESWGGLFVYTDMGAKEFCHFYKDHRFILHHAGIMAVDKMVSLVNVRESISGELTTRECECLLWLSAGLRNDQIASRLRLKPVTIEYHLVNARKKLGAMTREQAVATAIRLGLIEP